mgnify:CR=1 FL=1
MNLRKFIILPAALAFLPAAIFAAGTAAGYSRDKKPVSELEISVFSDPDAMFTNVLKARDFGAIPNDGKDDTQAIRKMFDAAEQNAKFVFEKGVYDVGMDGKGDYFKLAKKSDILLDGNGAKFRLHRVGRLFSLWEVKNAMLKNFSVETANLPFTGGEVVAVAGDSLYMKALAPHKIGSDLAARAIIRYDPKNKRYDANLFNVSLGENNTAEKVDEDTLRIKYKGPYPNVGDAIVLRHQIYAGGVCSVGDSKNILIKGIRIYDCAGMGAHFSSSENIALDGFKVKPRKGLWMSLTADATHFNSCRGSIEIINSEFEGMCDDATNIHGMYWQIESIKDKMLEMSYAKYRNQRISISSAPEAGDTLELPCPENYMRPTHFAKVESVSVSPDKKRIIVKTCDELPQWLAKDMAVSVKEYRPKVRIENCRVGYVRPRGFLIQTTGAVVKNCSFKDTVAMAILIEADLNTWGESAASDDILITDCVFENINSSKRNGEVAVFASAKFKKGLPFEGNIHGKIAVKNCLFKNCGKDPVRLEYTSNPIIENNIIE